MTTVFKIPLQGLGFTPDESQHVVLEINQATQPDNPHDPVSHQTLDQGEGQWQWEELDQMRRRAFALGMAAAGLTASEAATSATAAAAESVRHGLLASIPDTAMTAEVEEWESIAAEYAVRHLSTAPPVLLRSYLNDLHHLNIAMTARRDAPISPDLFRVAAILASLTAWTYGNLNAAAEAGRWWRTAHRLAFASRDLRTRVWVSAQEAVMTLYQPRPSLDAILDAIHRTEPLAKSVPFTPATAQLFGGKAQALGMAGRATEAEQALERLREVFAGLDSSVTNDRTSFLGWPETRLRYTESFTYSHLGDYAAASAAQDSALHLYSPTIRRDPVKIELQRALCLARSGASTDAARHACTQLASLDETQHDLPMADLAERVLRSLADDATDETNELRRYVTSRPLAITG
jgi:hypothetical protein